MTERERALFIAFFTTCGVLLLALVLGSDEAQAQSVGRPAKSVPIGSWMNAQGLAFGPTGLGVDGGVTTPVLHVAEADVGELYVDAGTHLRTLEVSGPASFREPPEGITKSIRSTLTRGTPLTVGLGLVNAWQSLGTVLLPGGQKGDLCAVTVLPDGLVLDTVDARCWVLAGGVVQFQVKTTAALTFPAGAYEARVIR